MQQYLIKQSSLLINLNLSLYLLVIFTILAFADEIWMAGLLVLLATLLLISDSLGFRSVKAHTPTAITLHTDSGEIEIQHLNDHEHFEKFTLHLNRWFVVLKLRDRNVTRNFLLIGERFESMTEYLNFRRQIIKMSKSRYAA